MSRENVEVVRAGIEAWNAGDMGAFGESYDPHVVVRYAEGWPEGSEPIMGREAVMRDLWTLHAALELKGAQTRFHAARLYS